MPSEIRHVTTRFGDIAYVEEGQGPAALFVHGVFLNHHFWRGVTRQLGDVRRCIALDLMAHGATRIVADQELTFTTQAEMLDAFCEAMGLDQVDVVANDSGGGIAQIFAARHPGRIRSLTLTNCDTHDNWPPASFQPLVALAREGKLADAFAPLAQDPAAARNAFAVAYEHPEQVSDETLNTYLAPLFASPEATAALERFVAGQDCRHTLAIEPELRRLEAPTLVIWGTDDGFFPTKWAYWLQGAIPGCRKVIEFEGAKLFFPEERPEALAGALREHWGA
jgi:pimeloyl-ACP methyl ester carboxylesterase